MDARETGAAIENAVGCDSASIDLRKETVARMYADIAVGVKRTLTSLDIKDSSVNSTPLKLGALYNAFHSFRAAHNYAYERGWITFPYGGHEPTEEELEGEHLLETLRGLQQTLGRPPAFDDIAVESEKKNDPRISPENYIKEFGSIPEARAAAGIPLTDEVRKADLAYLERRHGHFPSRQELAAASIRKETNSNSVYEKHGRTWSEWKAIMAAADPEKAELVARLQALRESLGRVPAYGDVAAAGEAERYIEAFGSFPNARVAAGICKERSDDGARKADLRDLELSLGHFPSNAELNEASARKKTLGCGAYLEGRRTLSDWQRIMALEDPDKAALISALQALKESLGRIPAYGDIEAYAANEAAENGSKITPEHYIAAFGSIPEARRVAGVCPEKIGDEERIADLRDVASRHGVDFPTREQLAEASRLNQTSSTAVYEGGDLAWNDWRGKLAAEDVEKAALLTALVGLRDSLGRVPAYGDVPNESDRQKYIELFGSFPKARIAAGISKKKSTPEERAVEARDLGERLGHSPSREEAEDAARRGEMQGPGEDWNDIKKAAHLPIFQGVRPAAAGATLPSEEEVERANKEIREVFVKRGHATYLDLKEEYEADKEGRLSPERIIEIHGSIPNARASADLFKTKEERRKELLDDLRAMADILGVHVLDLPKTALNEASKRGEMVHSTRSKAAFGTFNEAKADAASDPDYIPVALSKEQSRILHEEQGRPKPVLAAQGHGSRHVQHRPRVNPAEALRGVFEKRGRVTFLDLKEEHDADGSGRLSPERIIKIFGSIPAAREATGICESKEERRKAHLDDLRAAADMLGIHVLDLPEERVDKAAKRGRMCDVAALTSLFGSLAKARADAARDPGYIPPCLSNETRKALRNDPRQRKRHAAVMQRRAVILRGAEEARAVFEEKGRVTYFDLKSAYEADPGKRLSPETIIEACGSISKVREAAGISQSEEERRRARLDDLRALADALEVHVLDLSEKQMKAASREGRIADNAELITTFGSVAEAKAEAASDPGYIPPCLSEEARLALRKDPEQSRARRSLQWARTEIPKAVEDIREVYEKKGSATFADLNDEYNEDRRGRRSPETIIRLFGSISKAREAAGLFQSEEEQREAHLADLRALADQLKVHVLDVPEQRVAEAAERGIIAEPTVLAAAFGTLDQAKKEAASDPGYVPARMSEEAQRRAQRESAENREARAADQVRTVFEIKGRATYFDLKRAYDADPELQLSPEEIIKTCGSMPKARETAGVVESDEARQRALLDDLRAMADDLEVHVLDLMDRQIEAGSRAGRNVDCSELVSTFGSVAEAKAEAARDPRYVPASLSKEALLALRNDPDQRRARKALARERVEIEKVVEEIREVYERKGSATVADLNDAYNEDRHGRRSPGKIIELFGSIPEAREAAGIFQSEEERREAHLADLRALADQLKVHVTDVPDQRIAEAAEQGIIAKPAVLEAAFGTLDEGKAEAASDPGYIPYCLSNVAREAMREDPEQRTLRAAVMERRAAIFRAANEVRAVFENEGHATYFDLKRAYEADPQKHLAPEKIIEICGSIPRARKAAGIVESEEGRLKALLYDLQAMADAFGVHVLDLAEEEIEKGSSRGRIAGLGELVVTFESVAKAKAEAASDPGYIPPRTIEEVARQAGSLTRDDIVMGEQQLLRVEKHFDRQLTAEDIIRVAKMLPLIPRYYYVHCEGSIETLNEHLRERLLLKYLGKFNKNGYRLPPDHQFASGDAGRSDDMERTVRMFRRHFSPPSGRDQRTIGECVREDVKERCLRRLYKYHKDSGKVVTSAELEQGFAQQKLDHPSLYRYLFGPADVVQEELRKYAVGQEKRKPPQPAQG